MIQTNSGQSSKEPSRQPWCKLFSAWLTLLLILSPLGLTTGAAWAQATQPVTNTVTVDQVNAVARELWCPLCSGVRLDVCELKACEQMREEIALKLAAGENLEQIKAYFFERYGAQVLGKPPLQGFNWLAWLMPFVVLLGGGVFVLLRSRNLLRPALRVTPPIGTSEPTQVEDDPYARQLEKELKQYDR
jgi:cytochrome c-type biogenesis protein CcmH